MAKAGNANQATIFEAANGQREIKQFEMAKNFDHLQYNKKLKELARKLRKDSTPAEIRLWSELLRGRKMKDYQFLRQRPVINYIADFMCKELKLIIEVDGYSHEFEKQWYKDKKRQQELEDNGFAVLRIKDEEIFNDLENVSRAIEYWIESREAELGL